MPGKFYDINMIVQAKQVGEVVIVKTPEGDVATRPKDWICETPEGDRFILRNDLFNLIAVEL